MQYIILLITATTLSFCNNAYYNKLLFCLKPSVDPITIENKNLIKTNIESIDHILEKYEIISIEQWLTGATESDFDQGIYLNRIYRITTKDRDYNKLINIKEELTQANEVHSVEYEYIRRPFYTPNDQYYNNQWFCWALCTK